jgi:hypothetical protein
LAGTEVAPVLEELRMRVGFLLTLGEAALVGVLLLLLASGEVPFLCGALWMLLGRRLPGGEASLVRVDGRGLSCDAVGDMTLAPRHHPGPLFVVRLARAERHDADFWRARAPQGARRLSHRTIASQLFVVRFHVALHRASGGPRQCRVRENGLVGLFDQDPTPSDLAMQCGVAEWCRWWCQMDW